MVKNLKKRLHAKARKIGRIEHLLVGLVAAGSTSGVHMLEWVGNGVLTVVVAAALIAETCEADS